MRYYVFNERDNEVVRRPIYTLRIAIGWAEYYRRLSNCHYSVKHKSGDEWITDYETKEGC